MKPMSGAIEAVHKLSEHYEVFILSTAPWLNSTAWSDKLELIHKYFGKDEKNPLYKRVILSHHKDLLRGDYLIDDRTKNGAADFKGELLLFGSNEYPDWQAILNKLLPL